MGSLDCLFIDWLWIGYGMFLGFDSLLMVVSSVIRFLRVHAPFFDRLLSVSAFMLIFHGFCLLSLLSRDPSFWFSISSAFLTSLNFLLSSLIFRSLLLSRSFPIFRSILLYLSSTTLCSTSFFYHTLLYIFLDRLQLYSFKLFYHLLHHLIYYKLV